MEGMDLEGASTDYGILPRVCYQLFDGGIQGGNGYKARSNEMGRDGKHGMQVGCGGTLIRVSYVQVYNEEVPHNKYNYKYNYKYKYK